MKKLVAFFIIIFISCNKNSIEKHKSIENNYFDKAVFFRDKEETDSAYYYYAKAKDNFIKNNDSTYAAKCLVNMAIIQTDKGDFFGGIETSLEADKFLKKNDSITNEIKSANFNNIALANNELKDYENEKKYYFLAINSTFNQESKNVFYNNLANCYLDLNDFQQARIYYQKALKSKDSSSYARTLNNFGRLLFKENKNNEKALPYLTKSLEIRTKINDLWGLNSSYCTLADYYQKSSEEKSKFYAENMLKIATKIKSPDDQLEALQKLIRLDSENYQKYFVEFQSINDSLQIARNKAKNQFALIRYDAEKNRADFLKSQADNSIKENRILRQNIALGFMGVVFFGGYFWYRKRKKRLEQEKELEVRNTQLKFSKKVHDVVANNLYQTMVEVENLPEINKENLLNKLEKMYEESRDIAHENISEIAQKGFSQKLSEMISSYSSENHKVFIVGNQEKVWNNIPQKVRDELFYVLRELMVNMKKHSEAELISIKFEKNEKKLQIFYTDNGLGINDLEKNKNSGIKNTENRIFMIGGTINFEKNPKGGLLVNILIPINYV